MANHKSAEKRARQSIVKNKRNTEVRSRIHTAERSVVDLALAPKDKKESALILSKAFSTIQKARGVIHRNAVKRKMARLAKSLARGQAKAAAQSGKSASTSS